MELKKVVTKIAALTMAATMMAGATALPTYTGMKVEAAATVCATKDSVITTVYKSLKNKGFSTIAIAGILGNIEAESTFIPNNVKDTKEQVIGYNDSSYTAAVDNGSYSRDRFTNDGVGYGLPQFTYKGWKENLYDRAKQKGKSIADIEVQMEVLAEQAVQEKIKDEINNTKTPSQAAIIWLDKYEKPSAKERADSLNTRINSANTYYNQIKNIKVTKKKSNKDKLIELLFDADFYRRTNSDLINMNAQQLMDHFNTNGKHEGRMTSPYFDAKYYLAHNKDVAKKYGSKNYEAAFNHFVSTGFWQGRKGSQFFDVDYYLKKNPDVNEHARVFNKKKKYQRYFALRHYIQRGINEARDNPNRTASKTYNQHIYVTSYSDLIKAFGDNGREYIIHYINHGKKDGRNCTSYKTGKVSKISVASKKKTQATVKFSSVKFASGYQVAYSTKSNFKTKKYVNVKAHKTSVTLKKLKSKKVYYVKVRSYKVVNKKTYYGDWKVVKKVRVK